MIFSFLINVMVSHCFAQMCSLIGTLSQVNDVAHGRFFLLCLKCVVSAFISEVMNEILSD